MRPVPLHLIAFYIGAVQSVSIWFPFMVVFDVMVRRPIMFSGSFSIRIQARLRGHQPNIYKRHHAIIGLFERRFDGQPVTILLDSRVQVVGRIAGPGAALSQRPTSGEAFVF